MREKINFQHVPLCGKFLVGSSQVHDLLRRKLSFKDAHGEYYTGKRRVEGRNAEECLYQIKAYEIAIEKPFLISEHFPFLCATPDALGFNEEIGLHILEVKSGLDRSRALANANSKKTFAQVNTAMDIFNLFCAKICAMRRYGPPLFVAQLVEEKTILNCGYLFKKRKKLILSYVAFMTDFFSAVYGLTISTDTASAIFGMLNKHIPRRRPKASYATQEEIEKKLGEVPTISRCRCLRQKGHRVPHNLPDPNANT